MTDFRRLRLRCAAIALCLTGAATAAPAHATSYDLAGLWLFNEGSGQVARDLSFSGNPGQLGSTPEADSNDPTWVQLPRLGFIRRAALHFEGDDYVQVRNSPSLEPDGVTVVTRVRSTGPGAFRYVASKGALACWTASYGLYTDADGALRFYVSDGWDFALSPAAAPGMWDGDWHTVVGSYDGAGVSLWVDGVKVGTTPTSFTIGYGLPQADGFYVGSYGGPCSNPMGFQGDIDGVAVIGSYVGSTVGGLVD
jgi:hypothetical protein